MLKFTGQFSWYKCDLLFPTPSLPPPVLKPNLSDLCRFKSNVSNLRYDPNDDNDDEKFNVVRETAEEEEEEGEQLFGRMAPADVDEEIPEATTTSPPPSPPLPPRGRVRRGCISKQNRLCTQDTNQCRCGFILKSIICLWPSIDDVRATPCLGGSC